MAIKCVDVTPVYVNDQDRALEFFAGKLGMEKVRDPPDGPGRALGAGEAEGSRDVSSSSRDSRTGLRRTWAGSSR